MSKSPIRSKSNVQNEIVLYARNIDNETPFSIELAGETLPYNKYYIPRFPGAPYVFECVIKGKGYIVADGVKHTVTAGDFYTISDYSNLEYYADSDDPYQKVYVNCRGGLARRLCQVYNIDFPFFIYRFPRAEKYIRSMHRILCNSRISISTKDSNCGYILHHMLSTLYDEMQESKSQTGNDVPYAIRTYLDQAIFQKITLDDLTNVFFISKTRLISLFSEHFGVTPYQYLISQRISMACSLLKNSNLSIREISEMLQFTDPHYFSSFFKSKVGCSPAYYRRNDFQS